MNENIIHGKSENTSLHMIVKHESIRIALIRQENAARTEVDFEKLIETWDRLDSNRERRERRKEIGFAENTLEGAWVGDEWIDEPIMETIIPPPINHIWWRKLLKGEFLDIIHDCPHEIQEFTSSRNIYELVGELTENQKEILYYRAIRYWSNQRIAAIRGQTDRNILKSYTTLIEGIRRKLYLRLLPRYIAETNTPSAALLTFAQREFMERNFGKYSETEKIAKPRK